MVLRHGFFLGEKTAEHRAEMIGGKGHPGTFCGFAHAVAQRLGMSKQIIVKAGFADDRHGSETRRHGDRIARQRARLIDGTQRRNLLHDVSPPTKGADRHAATNHFP